MIAKISQDILTLHERASVAKDVLEPNLIWDGDLYGNILCEGAQGVWLDINH